MSSGHSKSDRDSHPVRPSESLGRARAGEVGHEMIKWTEFFGDPTNPKRYVSRILNFTLHKQGEDVAARLADWCCHADFDSVAISEPVGFEVSPDEDFQSVLGRVEKIMDEAVKERIEAVLLGGLTSITIAAFMAAMKRGIKCCEVVTERIRDANDRFVFNVRGIRWIPDYYVDQVFEVPGLGKRK